MIIFFLPLTRMVELLLSLKLKVSVIFNAFERTCHFLKSVFERALQLRRLFKWVRVALHLHSRLYLLFRRVDEFIHFNIIVSQKEGSNIPLPDLTPDLGLLFAISWVFPRKVQAWAMYPRSFSALYWKLSTEDRFASLMFFVLLSREVLTDDLNLNNSCWWGWWVVVASV